MSKQVKSKKRSKIEKDMLEIKKKMNLLEKEMQAVHTAVIKEISEDARKCFEYTEHCNALTEKMFESQHITFKEKMTLFFWLLFAMAGAINLIKSF